MLEKIANYAFPKISTPWKQAGSLAIANLVVWNGAGMLGHPLRLSFLLIPAISKVYQIISQAKAASEQQRAMMMRKLTA